MPLEEKVWNCAKMEDFFFSSFCGIKVVFGFEAFAFGHYSSQSLTEWTALRQTIEC